MDDDRQARDRLLNYTAVRFAGLIVFFIGIAVVYTNLARPGGWPQLGAIIAIAGVVGAFFMPRILKRSWDRRDKDLK